MTGDVAVVQDADLEYDPHDYLRLLAPIRDGRADAVFGSRFAGETHRVLYFWHSVGNKLLTLLSNMANDVNLTDMETCYKMVRADVLRQLRLQSNTFTLEPEITCRLAQWGARIYEVPISYSGRTYLEGKKIKAIDGVEGVLGSCSAAAASTRSSRTIASFYLLKSTARARKFNRWLLDSAGRTSAPADAGAGRGHRQPERLLLDRTRLVLVDRDPTVRLPGCKASSASAAICASIQADLAKPEDFRLERRTDRHRSLLQRPGATAKRDEQVLRSMHDALLPGGHCIVIVPAGKWLYTGMDRGTGRLRRYGMAELREKMERAGFEIVSSRSVGRLGSLCWWFSGKILRRRQPGPLANAAGGPAAAAHPPAGLLPARSGRDRSLW